MIAIFYGNSLLLLDIRIKNDLVHNQRTILRLRGKKKTSFVDKIHAVNQQFIFFR
jgi:4-hydroxy-3-methylbut-2-enyl diphosphate reductase IspH